MTRYVLPPKIKNLFCFVIFEEDIKFGWIKYFGLLDYNHLHLCLLKIALPNWTAQPSCLFLGVNYYLDKISSFNIITIIACACLYTSVIILIWLYLYFWNRLFGMDMITRFRKKHLGYKKGTRCWWSQVKFFWLYLCSDFGRSLLLPGEYVRLYLKN